MNRTLPLVLCLTALVLLSPGVGSACRAGESPADENIRSLIAGLDADDWGRREVAEKELLLLGAAAVPALEAAAAKAGAGAESKERIGRLLEKLRPLAALAGPDRRARIAAALEVNETAEGLLAGGDAVGALALYRQALPANPDLLDSKYVREQVGSAARSLSATSREEFAKTDLGMFLAGRLDDLREAYPQSWLTGKILCDQGKFDACLKLFPQGFYAPRARYCTISGYRSYWRPEDSVRPMKMTDPDREVREWPQFLKDFPDFEGADDAGYRLARALEEKGRPAEACMQLRFRLGDEDMQFSALERLLFVMDAKMSGEELKSLRAQLEKDATPRDRLRLPNSDLVALTLYLEALKLLRDGKYSEAAEAFDRVPKPATRGPEAPQPEAGALAEAIEKALAEDEGEDEGEGGEDDSPLTGLAELAAERSAFAARAARLAGNADAGKLRDLAALMCSGESRFFFMTGLDWSGGLAVSSYDAATGPEEFFRRRSRFWQAAQVCERLLAAHPKAPEAADALYMLAVCHCRLAETHWAEHNSAFWRKAEVDNVKKSIDLYVRFAREYPDDERFGKARHAAEYLTDKWFWNKEGGKGAKATPEAEDEEGIRVEWRPRL